MGKYKTLDAYRAGSRPERPKPKEEAPKVSEPKAPDTKELVSVLKDISAKLDKQNPEPPKPVSFKVSRDKDGNITSINPGN